MKNLRSDIDNLINDFVYNEKPRGMFIDNIRSLFTHLIEEEAKGMEIKTSGKGWIDSTNWSGYREAISDYKSRLIEAVKGGE